MIFGGINSTQYVGNLSDFSLKTNHWWALDMREFLYGDTSVASFSYTDNAIAVIDTGTSLACVPNDVYTKLMTQWRSSLPAVDCSQSICYVK